MILGIAAIVLLSWYVYQTQWSGSSPTIAAAVDKQLDSNDTVDQIVDDKSANGGKLVFYIRRINHNGIVLDTRFFKKTLRGWEATRYSGGMSGGNIAYHPDEQLILDMPLSHMYLPKRKRIALNPTILGTVIDPTVSKIMIKSGETGEAQQAKLVKVQGKLKMYYAILTNNLRGQFDVLAYDAKGDLVKKQSFDSIMQSSGSGTTKKAS